MREIMFRGKRIDNDEWVYGSFVMDATELRRRENFPNSPIWADGFIRRYDFENEKIEMYEVDRESVGQYTGLTDKNGKKIFEGDILEVNCKEFFEAKHIVYRVEWDRCNCEFSATLKSGATGTGVAYIPLYAAEVIGNVYDHPELLERRKHHGK